MMHVIEVSGCPATNEVNRVVIAILTPIKFPLSFFEASPRCKVHVKYINAENSENP
jgi:hypothetical protein